MKNHYFYLLHCSPAFRLGRLNWTSTGITRIMASLGTPSMPFAYNYREFDAFLIIYCVY